MQLSRIKQRPPTTALSGPKASVDSLTPRRSNLAAEATVDPHSDLLSSSALVSTVGFEISVGLLCVVLRIGWDQSEMEEGSASSRKKQSDVQSRDITVCIPLDC